MGRVGQHVFPAHDLPQQHLQGTALLVPLLLSSQHGRGTGIDTEGLSFLVVSHHAEGQVFHDTLIQSFDPNQFPSIGSDALHHPGKGPGQLAHLVRLAQILLHIQFFLFWTLADALANLTETADGVRDVVSNEYAGLDNDHQHGYRRQDHIFLFLNEPLLQGTVIQAV